MSISPLLRAILLSLTSSAIAGAVITENFDSYPGGGSGWAGSWVESEGLSGVSRADGTLSTASPLKGGGSYLSVTTAVSSTELGIRRGLGAVASAPYTLTFDWRLDSSMTNFVSYNDRIHFGANSDVGFGTSVSWSWLIGVVGGDNGATTFDDGKWYFYDNNSSANPTTDSAFNSDNMRVSNISLAAGVTYSFTVTVNPLTRKYDASITDGTNTFTQIGMDFRNQTAAASSSTNLVFGGSTSSVNDQLTWSIDNINIVPEPSSMLLVAASGVLCFVRRRA